MTTKASLLLVLKTALPLTLSSLLLILIQSANTYFMGHDAPPALYLFSLYVPFSFFILAVTEALAITAQVIAAKRYGERNLDGLGVPVLLLSLIGVLSIGAVTGLVWLSRDSIGEALSLEPVLRPAFFAFVVKMLLVNALMIPAMVMDAALRGTGRVNFAFALLLTITVFHIGLMSYLTRQGLGLDAVIYAGVAGAGLLFVMAAGALGRAGLLGIRRPPIPAAFETMAFARIVGLPIFFSYVLIFVSLFFYNKIVAGFGPVVVSGFGIGYRIQTMVTLPAMAIGAAMAILMNHQIGARLFDDAYRIFRSGIFGVLGAYLLVSLVVFVLREPLVALFTTDPAIIREGVRFLSIVAPTYLLMGTMLSLLVLLEQTDDGPRAFLFNLVYFVPSIVVGWALCAHFSEPDWLYKTLAGFNLFAATAIVLEIRRQRRKYAYLLAGGR